MKLNTPRLPGITRIAYLPCESLPMDITLRAMSGIPIAIATDATHIKKIGTAVCETDQQFDFNSQIEKVTLSFSTNDEIPTYMDLAFMITDVRGYSYVIGTRESPFPVIKRTDTTASPGGSPSVNSYEVTFSSKKALVKVIA